MKTIIAGSRNLENFNIGKAVIDSKFIIREVVSGHSGNVDFAGEFWANDQSIPCKLFPANWKKYGTSAGPIRNKCMAEYADSLILIWDGKSRGSKSMLQQAMERNLPIHSVIIS